MGQLLTQKKDFKSDESIKFINLSAFIGGYDGYYPDLCAVYDFLD